MLNLAVTLRDQQTAMQPRQPQGSTEKNFGSVFIGEQKLRNQQTAVQPRQLHGSTQSKRTNEAACSFAARRSPLDSML